MSSARPLAVLVSLSLVSPGLAAAAPAAATAASPETTAPEATTPAPETPPADPAATPAPQAPPPGYGPPPPGYGPPPPGYDPYLEAHLANEWQFADRLQKALGENLMDEWDDFVKDERDRAEDRARGEDERPETFDRHMHDRYKRKRVAGIVLVGVGFAPLLFGGLLSLTFEEPIFMTIAIPSVPLWAAGGAVWGVGQSRLRHYEDVRNSLGRTARRPRLHFRGAAPLVNPYTNTGGLSLRFAF